MARGAEEKTLIQNKILENFEGAFVYGKEIRVPVGDVQIKIALTCAKDNVAPGADNAIPGAPSDTKIAEGAEPTFEGEQKEIKAPSQEELDNVTNLLSSLGL